MQADCDCEKILVDVDHHNEGELAKLNFNPKWEDPIIAESFEKQHTPADQFTCYYQQYSSIIAKGFLALPFHPPAIV